MAMDIVTLCVIISFCGIFSSIKLYEIAYARFINQIFQYFVAQNHFSLSNPNDLVNEYEYYWCYHYHC